jgi:hypothetical protein
MYERVATEPEGDFHFHRGPAYAAGLLGYDPTELAALPEGSTASFAGVGNPLAIGLLYPGWRSARAMPRRSPRRMPASTW